MSDDAAVLIVGAGPTGMVLASELLRRRISCRMIDKRPGGAATSRSFTLHAKTMEMFEHMGLANRFLEDGIKSRGFYFHFKRKDAHPVLDFTRLASSYPYILVYNQNDTEQRLREHLDAAYDFRPEWNLELTALTQLGDRCEVTLRDVSGREHTLNPRWVVGCDGVHSFVRRSAGLDYVGENYEGMIMQMMDVDYRGFGGGDDWVHYYIAKDSFLLVTKLPSGRHRVLISDMGEADDPNLTPRESFQRLIDGHIEGTVLGEPLWATKWQIWKRLATAFDTGRCFLAGDAAHVHSPSGGQGMNAGMQDAFNLGWKLAMVQSGRARPELLETYSPEREPIGAQVISGTDAMHDIIMAHGHEMEDRLELTLREGWHDEAVNRISGLSYTYRDVVDVPKGLKPLRGPACGDRAPDVTLASGRRLFEVVRSSRLVLVSAGGSSGRSTAAALLNLYERATSSFGHVLRNVVLADTAIEGIPHYDCLADENHDFGRVYGDEPGGQLCLIRPDGYIALRCHLDESERLFEHLDAWFVRQD